MSDDSDNGPFTDSDTGISTDAVFTTGQLSPSVGGNTSSGSQPGSGSSPPFPPFTPPPPRRELTRIPDRDLPRMDPMDQYRRNFNLPTAPPDGYGSSGSSPESQRHAGSNAGVGSPPHPRHIWYPRYCGDGTGWCRVSWRTGWISWTRRSTWLTP